MGCCCCCCCCWWWNRRREFCEVQVLHANCACWVVYGESEMEAIGGGGGGFCCCYFLFGRKKNSKLVWTLRVEWRSLKDHSFQAVRMFFLPFFCCHWKTHNFLQGILMCPGNPHHCERQRHRERDTHTHIQRFCKAFSWVGQFHIIVREREILEFCIEELELDCKM